MAGSAPLGRSRAVVMCVAILIAATACSTPGSASGHPVRVVQVVAAESFWGSIASQIGGSHAHVASIVSNPAADPHAYEPTTGDARSVALAQMVIVNGAGYDPWMSHLLSADSGRRTVLTVGRLLRVPDGGNPHRWYNPSDVQAVVAAIASDLARLDPLDGAYFRDKAGVFNNVGMRAYDSLVAEIRDRYTGTPVGASESIFSMLAPALGLDVITPYSFLKAISEGTDVSPADKAKIDSQIKHHRIRIYIYNVQNTTPDVQAQLQECKAAGIPAVYITETLTPATATYEAWQVHQLQRILRALQEASAS